MKPVLLAVLLWFVWLGPSLAALLDMKRFEVLNTSDGLSQNSVQSIFCDSRGFLWFGTMDGLNRYDGYNFKVFKTEYNKPGSLTNNRIVAIWEDRRGFIWMASHDGHYHYLDCRTEKFYTFPPTTEPGNPRNTRMTSFLELKNEIWLGSNNAGLYRLRASERADSVYAVSNLHSGTGHAISEAQVNFMLTDADSGIWVGTAAGLNYFPASALRGKQLGEGRVFLPDQNVTCGVAFGNQLVFGTKKNGLLRVNLGLMKPEKFLLAGLDDAVSLLRLSSNGKLLVGTETNGLFVCDADGQLLRTYLKGQSVESCMEDSRGNLWVATDEFGIIRIKPDWSDAVFYELVPKEIQTLVDQQRQYLFEDRDKNLWVATHGGGLGLFDYGTDKFHFYRNNPDDPNSLSSDIAFCVAQDKSGMIWVGTGQFKAGVNKLIPANPLFRQLKPEHEVNSLSDNQVRALAQDSRENIWLATKSGRLYVYDKQFKLNYQFEGIPTKQGRQTRFNVYSILEDSRGYIWLGSKGGGLARSNKPLSAYPSYHDIFFTLYRHRDDVPNSISSNAIYCIAEDNEGRVLLGNYGSGIDLVERPEAAQLSFRNINLANSNLSCNEVRYILVDLGGTVWVATTFGLNKLLSPITDPNPRFANYFYDVNYNRSLSYNDLVYLYEDSAHRMWLGTFGGGVNRILQNTDDEVIFSHESEREGLINDAVFGILEGRKGDLWLSTENGISRYNVLSREFHNYDEYNGLVCSNFSEGTCLKLDDGRLLFGTLDGLLIVTDNEVTSNRFQPPVVFTGFSLFNREVPFDVPDSPLKQHINFTDDIILKHNQSSFSVEYAALSYFDPNKNRYAYMLDGFDSDWYEVRNERKATYTNLSPGYYTFKVKAASWDGTWSESPRTIRITILPPWWRTKWAYLLWVVMLLGVLELSRRIFLKYNRLRTDLEVERKVNEIKLKFFTNISHEIRTPLTLVLGPIEELKRMEKLPDSARKAIEMMSSNGKRMLRLINQLLDFRKMQNQKMRLKLAELDLRAFVTDICGNFAQLAQQQQIDFRLPEKAGEIKVWMDPEKMDSVFFNLLSNAFKFTPAGKCISVRLETDSRKNEVRVLVEDEGRGIARNKMSMLFQRFTALSDENPEQSGSGIGLAYSAELINLHHGKLEARSTEGQGSTFTVSLKLGKAHFSAAELKYRREEQLRAVNHPEKPELGPMTADEPDTVTEKPEFTLLVVEDQDDIRQYIVSVLQRSYVILQAANGQRGLEMAREKHPDLIVTDLMMPVMDGMKMTRTIKDDFELSHIPVVMLTAKSAEEDQLEGLDSGAEAYVMKPFNPEYLQMVIQNLLKQRQNVLARFNKGKPFVSDLKITNKDEVFLNSLVNLITQNCQDVDFNVDALVGKIALGRTVFYNKVKTLTGMSPVEFLRNTKLQIAAQYLEAGGYNVSEAAYLCGFNDLKYFSKKFKERYGMSPSQYGKDPN